MTLARKAWAVLPVQRRAAASLMRACMRRRLLMRKLEAFRAACVHLPFNSVINLRSIPRAQREAIRKVFPPPREPVCNASTRVISPCATRVITACAVM